MSDVIIKIQPSAGRRLLAAVLLGISALILLGFIFRGTAQSGILKLVLFGFSMVFLWQMQANLRFGNAALILKREGLFDETGALICKLSNIATVDRSWFSFKPSNGFLLRLHNPMGWKWSPGLYWIMGRSFGVGGTVSLSQSKAMSDKLVLLMQEK
ncbi:MAG: hypothetical protein QM492_00720 [Rhodobacterales bacterium]